MVSADVSKIQGDDELQSWGKLLSTSMKNGGAGIQVKRRRTILFIDPAQTPLKVKLGIGNPIKRTNAFEWYFRLQVKVNLDMKGGALVPRGS